MNEFEKQFLGLMEQAKKAGVVGAKAVDTPGSSLMYARGMFGCDTESAVLSAVQTDTHFMDWLGFMPSTEALRRTKMIEAVGPALSGEDCDWDRAAACGDCPTVRWSKCELMHCFGEVCGRSPALKATEVGLSQWVGQPRFFVRGPLGGQRIENDEERLMSVTAQVLVQNMARKLIVGNKTTNDLDFDGLQVLINTPVTDARTGTRCYGIEPIIYDWGNVAMDADICDVLDYTVREIRRRASFLGGSNSAAGDIVIVCRNEMRNALLEYAACGCSACNSGTGTTFVDTYRRRDEMARLYTGGLYGDGMIEVDGVPVSFVTSDWIPYTSIAPRFRSDIYVLTRTTGLQPVMYGEYQDFASTVGSLDLATRINGWITDQGRFMHWAASDNECYQISSLAKLRMICHAPWLQARITGVEAPFTLDPNSPDPCDDYFPAAPMTEADALTETDYSSC